MKNRLRDLFSNWLTPGPTLTVAPGKPPLEVDERKLLRDIMGNRSFQGLIQTVMRYEAACQDDYTRNCLNSGNTEEATRSAAAAQTFLDIWSVLQKHATEPIKQQKPAA